MRDVVEKAHDYSDVIMGLTYIIVFVFSVELPGMMGSAYLLVGMVHVAHMRVEKAQKKEKHVKVSDTV